MGVASELTTRAVVGGVRAGTRAAKNASKAKESQTQELEGYQPPDKVDLPPGLGKEMLIMQPSRPVIPDPQNRISLSEVLEYTRGYISMLSELPSDAALNVCAFWAMHQAARNKKNELIWYATPRLFFLSNEPGAGKSRSLEIQHILSGAKDDNVPMIEMTFPVVAHMLGKEKYAAFLDEGDILFGAGRRKESLRAILNGGYRKRGGVVSHMRGSKRETIPVFGPVALAGLDVLETTTGDNLKPLLDRAIIIRVTKADRRISRIKDNMVELGKVLALALWASCQQWQEELITAQDIPMPPWLIGRQEEIWSPLFAIGHVADMQLPDDEKVWSRAIEDAAKRFTQAQSVVDSDNIMSQIQAQMAALSGS
jgi:hypothetical protein